MNIPKLNIVAIVSSIGAILLWGWQPIESIFTGGYNENLNVQINSEIVETCRSVPKGNSLVNRCNSSASNTSITSKICSRQFHLTNS